MDDTGLIQLRLQLVSQIPWNYKEQHAQCYSKVPISSNNKKIHQQNGDFLLFSRFHLCGKQVILRAVLSFYTKGLFALIHVTTLARNRLNNNVSMDHMSKATLTRIKAERHYYYSVVFSVLRCLDTILKIFSGDANGSVI